MMSPFRYRGETCRASLSIARGSTSTRAPPPPGRERLEYPKRSVVISTTCSIPNSPRLRHLTFQRRVTLEYPLTEKKLGTNRVESVTPDWAPAKESQREVVISALSQGRGSHFLLTISSTSSISSPS